MLRLNNLKSPKGAHRNIKRIGRGQGSGQGCQAGKGHKGQKARSGGGIAIGFEGGQMPLYRRLPKKGFSNYPFRREFAEVRLDDLDKRWEEGKEVTREGLIENKFLKGRQKSLPIKVLGNGHLKKKLTFKGIEKFTKSAEEKISSAGGSIEKL